MRGKQYLAAIRPSDNVLVLETMHFADEVRDPAGELDQLPIRTKVTGKDLDMAVSLVKAMTSPWKPTNYRDTYTELQELIDAKKKPEISYPRRARIRVQGLDLLDALQAPHSAKARRQHST